MAEGVHSNDWGLHARLLIQESSLGVWSSLGLVCVAVLTVGSYPGWANFKLSALPLLGSIGVIVPALLALLYRWRALSLPRRPLRGTSPGDLAAFLAAVRWRRRGVEEQLTALREVLSLASQPTHRLALARVVPWVLEAATLHRAHWTVVDAGLRVLALLSLETGCEAGLMSTLPPALPSLLGSREVQRAAPALAHGTLLLVNLAASGPAVPKASARCGRQALIVWDTVPQPVLSLERPGGAKRGCLRRYMYLYSGVCMVHGVGDLVWWYGAGTVDRA
jgi:hypothetical protein